jgi:hypothetical protein
VFDNVTIKATAGMKAYFVTGLVFKNGSSISVPTGNAVTTYNASVAGINLTTGKPVAMALLHPSTRGPDATAVVKNSRVLDLSGRIVKGKSTHAANGLRIIEKGSPGKYTPSIEQ